MEHEEIRGNFIDVFRKLEKQGNRITAIETGNVHIMASTEERMKRIESNVDNHNNRITSLEERIIKIVTIATVCSAVAGWLIPWAIKQL